VAVNGSQSYAPYGDVFGASGVMSSPFAFTGEPLDGNGLQYHRARYMSPALGGFLSLDPFEGMYDEPMSLNGYSWVEGNVINSVDPSGHQPPRDRVGPVPAPRIIIDRAGNVTRTSPTTYTQPTGTNLDIRVSSTAGGVAPLTPPPNYSRVVTVIMNDSSAVNFAYKASQTNVLQIANHWSGEVGMIWQVEGLAMRPVCFGVNGCATHLGQEVSQESGTGITSVPSNLEGYTQQLLSMAGIYNSMSPQELAEVCNGGCHPELTPQPTATPDNEDDCEIEFGIYPNIPQMAETRLANCVPKAYTTLQNIRSNGASYDFNHMIEDIKYQNREGGLPPITSPYEYREYRARGGGTQGGRILTVIDEEKGFSQYERGFIYYTIHYVATGGFVRVIEGT